MFRVPSLILAATLVAACGGREAPEEGQDLSLMPPADSVAAVVSPEELQPQTEQPPAAGAPTPSRPAQRPAPSPRPATATPAPPPAAPAPAPLVAPVGTELATTSTVEITSRRNKAGETFTASLTEAYTDAAGREVLPAGSVVTFTILEIKEAENRDAKGSLVIRPTSVAIGDARYELRAEVVDLQYSLQGRGVTAGDAGKVAAGAAAGAVVGQILGRKTTSTVVGGVVGAAAGTAIAVQTADRDVVVPAGSRIVIRLTQPLERPAA